MRSALAILTLALLSFSGGSAYATSDCASLKSAYERRDCTRKRYELADRDLNRVYQIVVRKLMADNARRPLNRLRQAQRQWIKDRDATCQAEAKDRAGGGTEEIREQYLCVNRLTQERTHELKAEFRVR